MFDDLKDTKNNDSRFSVFPKPETILTADETRIVYELQHRLHTNEHTRTEIWSSFMPTLILVLLFYTLVSILWLFYNVRLYRRQRSKAQKNRVARCAETSRRLEFYNQIPIDVQSDNEEIELVKNIRIVENGVEVHNNNNEE